LLASFIPIFPFMYALKENSPFFALLIPKFSRLFDNEEITPVEPWQKNSATSSPV